MYLTLAGGCSAIQCGLADLQCNPLMLDDCVDAYYRCVADSAAIGSGVRGFVCACVRGVRVRVCMCVCVHPVRKFILHLEFYG